MMNEYCIRHCSGRMHPPNDPKNRITEKMTFDEWLLFNYSETQESLETKILRIGTHENLRKCLEWYMRQYRKEKEWIISYRQMKLFN